MKGAPAQVISKNRPAVTALREIAAQRVRYSQGRQSSRRVHHRITGSSQISAEAVVRFV